MLRACEYQVDDEFHYVLFVFCFVNRQAIPWLTSLTQIQHVHLQITSDSSTGVVQPSMVVQMFQFLVAMLVMGTWQYFVHRYMHQNKFLYRHIHS
jgi:sterol desaturase/sphingolipid hydroxylase (fatty acid hydroxylase superfamily)